MFMAKGGGSANKSFLFQTPSVPTKDRLLAFLKEKVLTLGTGGVPAIPPRDRDRRHLGRTLHEDR